MKLCTSSGDLFTLVTNDFKAPEIGRYSGADASSFSAKKMVADYGSVKIGRAHERPIVS